MSIIDGIRDLAERIGAAALPPQIRHPFGRYLLRRHGEDVHYIVSHEDDPRPARAGLVEHHAFDDVASLRDWAPNEITVFVAAPRFEAATVRGLALDEPQRGTATCSVARHPAWLRWSRALDPRRQHTDLSHVELADLLLDSQEELVEPMLAKQIAQFHAVRTVEYDADLAEGASQGVRVAWAGKGGQRGAEGAVAVPRTFEARIPAYSGAWEPGEEPRHLARFRVRVGPGDDSGAPKFRVSWADAFAFEQEAADALLGRVRELMDDHPVYRGVPKAEAFVLPPRPEPKAQAQGLDPNDYPF